jgi:NTE family protein
VSGPGAGLALVLGAGGVRGIAHVGVIEALARQGVVPDAIVGVSCGALVAACHAALGWEAGRLADSAGRFGPLAALALALRRPWLSSLARRLSEVGVGGGGLGEVGDLLAGLERADFDRLHHGVRHLGILCLDRISAREKFFVTGRPEGRPPLAQAVVGSMTLPLLFPAQRVSVNGVRMTLVDGGIRRTLPIGLAVGEPVRAARVLAVDLGVMTGEGERRLDHRRRLTQALGERLRVLRPAVGSFGIVVMRPRDPDRLIEAGRRAVTDDVLRWLDTAPSG